MEGDISVLLTSELNSLRNIDIANSHFSGHLPSTIGELKALTHLGVTLARDAKSPKYFLDGPIPKMDHLLGLETIDLTGNSFTGLLPNPCSLPISLKHLHIGRLDYADAGEYSGLTGPFWREWPTLERPNLRTFSPTKS